MARLKKEGGDRSRKSGRILVFQKQSAEREGLEGDRRDKGGAEQDRSTRTGAVSALRSSRRGEFGGATHLCMGTHEGNDLRIRGLTTTRETTKLEELRSGSLGGGRRLATGAPIIKIGEGEYAQLRKNLPPRGVALSQDQRSAIKRKSNRH